MLMAHGHFENCLISPSLVSTITSKLIYVYPLMYRLQSSLYFVEGIFLKLQSNYHTHIIFLFHEHVMLSTVLNNMSDEVHASSYHFIT